jgi:hypothetical protein
MPLEETCKVTSGSQRVHSEHAVVEAEGLLGAISAPTYPKRLVGLCVNSPVATSTSHAFAFAVTSIDISSVSRSSRLRRRVCTHTKTQAA